MFGAVYGAEGVSTGALVDVAGEFSPRFEVCGPREVTLDLSGLERLFGDARTIGQELRRTAADRGLRVRIAIAGTRTAARLFVHHRAGVTVIDPGTEAASLAPLPMERLEIFLNPEPRTIEPGTTEPGTRNPELRTVRHWGLRTLGELAALPADAVAARMGQDGVQWQRLARGDDPRPLLPAVSEERFEQALDLEWPIEGLEPLSFVLGRLMEPLSAHLERRGRGAAVLHVRLHLVNTHGETRIVHERSLQLPAPMRDARTLRTLAMLDLESHPPPAAIDRVVVAVDPTPGRVLQFSLLARPLPSPEQLSTLMARLHALMGAARCGSLVAVDSWQPGAFAIKPFAPPDANAIHSVANQPALALRRFRLPVAARVRVEDGRPARVVTDRRGLSGGRVEMCAGPWRTSGGWWTGRGPFDEPRSHGVAEENQKHLRVSVSPWPVTSWDRDEWDVTLGDGATYRLFRERAAEVWFIEGIVD